MKVSLLTLFIVILSMPILAGDPDQKQGKDFQIHLSKPAKEIRLMLYENNFVPVQGKLSEDRKSIIIKEYVKGSKVRVKVEYEDGTVEEFVRNPCYIDPVPA
jgi:hypothetical protein